MSRPTCCSFDCNQGRKCPHRPAVTHAAGQALIGLVAVLALLAILGGAQ